MLQYEQARKTRAATWLSYQGDNDRRERKSTPLQPQQRRIQSYEYNPAYTNMPLLTVGDVPLLIISDNSHSERRITPSWTIGQLKAKLEAVTGIPPLSQRLVINSKGSGSVVVEALDEENVQISNFPLSPYAELHVS